MYNYTDIILQTFLNILLFLEEIICTILDEVSDKDQMKFKGNSLYLIAEDICFWLCHAAKWFEDN